MEVEDEAGTRCRSSQSHEQQCFPKQGPEYNALLDMTEDLCKGLPIRDLFPSMISLRVIDIGDMDELCHNKSEKKIVEKFIQTHLYRDLVLGDTSRFRNFVSAMRKSDKCVFLVKRLEERITHHQNKISCCPG